MGILDGARPPSAGWVVTRWTVIQGLARPASEDWDAAWAYLVRTYTEPMRRYVERLWTRAPRSVTVAHDPADVVQAFLAACVEKGWLSRADPLRGRFRSYLQVLLRRFAFGLIRQESARRRQPGPGRSLVEWPEGDLPDEAAPVEAQATDEFHRTWVRVALDRALDRLTRENARSAEVLRDLAATGGQGSPDIAGRLGVEPVQLALLRHRARKRFARLLERELARTVTSPEDLEAEWEAIRPYLPPGF